MVMEEINTIKARAIAEEKGLKPGRVKGTEGVQFTNGKVAVCWRTETNSISIWDSLEDLMKIHGHPEYETVFKWLDSVQNERENKP